MLINLGKSLSREEMKNVKGGYDNLPPWCAPTGSQPYGYELGCCKDTCHEFGVGDICWDVDAGPKPCRDILM